MNLYIQKNKLWLFLLVLALLPYFYISFFSNPIADDFSYAFKGKNLPLFETLVWEYFHWNGRYISNIFVLINPIAFDSFIGYKFVPILLLVLTIISLYFFLLALLKKALNKHAVFLLSLLLTLLYLYQMPILSEGFYWYTGAVTYQGGLILLLFYLGLLINFFNQDFFLKNKFIHVFLLAFIMFLTVGFNEIAMIVMVLFSAFVLIVNRLYKFENYKPLIFLFVASICFGSLVYFAPGNTSRASNFTGNHLFLYSLSSSIAQCLRFFFEWTSSVPLILLSLTYYELNKKLSVEINIFKKSFYLTPLVSLSLLFLVIFIGTFPAYWSTGMQGQHRTMNVSYFLFILIWFINLTVFYNKNIFSVQIKNNWVKLGVLIFVWFSLVFTKKWI